MKQKKKVIIGVVAVIVLAAIFLGVYLANRPAVSEGGKSFTVEVVHADGSSKTFEYSSDAEYLGEVLLDEGLVSGEEGDYGLYITEVDGEQAIYEESGAYWAFYVNGEYGTVGVDAQPVTDGDSYQLVYTVG